jgi:FkbM family methyltransferase
MDNKIQPRESVANSQGEFSEVATTRRCKLPNNMEIAYQSKVEAEYFYKDIFEKQIYLRHGITLKDGDCVFDVGGNIGLFTLFVHQQQKNLTVYTFEPAPVLFEIMRFNISRNGFNAKLFNCGLSNQTKPATFTFYLKNSGMSSFYADVKEEKKVMRTIMLNQLNQRRQGITGMEQVMQDADDLIDDLLEDRFESETYICQLRTLYDVIAEYHVEQIDLLKIDVQKSEWDIITGIEEDDWHKIKQIVMEVHDIKGRLNQIITLLQQHKYQVFVEQDDMCEGSNLYNLFAIKNHLDVSLAD